MPGDEEQRDGKHVRPVVRRLARDGNSEEMRNRADRLETIGIVAGKLAHDFNNTLTTILGYSELLLANLGPDDPSRKDLEQIQRAGRRAAAVNQGLLAFRHRHPIPKKPLDLNELLAGMDMGHRYGDSRIVVEIRTDPGIGKVRADRNRMEQVIGHLLSNAREATPRGGKITVSTGELQLEEPGPGIIPVTGGRYVLLDVTDTGDGMDEETQSHLFEPLFTTKPKAAGSGLGLFTAYAIIKQYGGTIAWASKPSGGTTFQVYLPVSTAQPDGPEPKARQPHGKKACTTGKVILLVEDEEAVRTLVKEILKQGGFTVIEASNGPAALEFIDRQDLTIDLLLTDVVMPRMSGRNLASILEERRPGTRVLYMSGHTDEALVGPDILHNETNFIQKPFSPAALLQKIGEVLCQKPHVS